MQHGMPKLTVIKALLHEMAQGTCMQTDQCVHLCKTKWRCTQRACGFDYVASIMWMAWVVAGERPLSQGMWLTFAILRVTQIVLFTQAQRWQLCMVDQQMFQVYPNC
jgi:hypothetical protein